MGRGARWLPPTRLLCFEWRKTTGFWLRETGHKNGHRIRLLGVTRQHQRAEGGRGEGGGGSLHMAAEKTWSLVRSLSNILSDVTLTLRSTSRGRVASQGGCERGTYRRLLLADLGLGEILGRRRTTPAGLTPPWLGLFVAASRPAGLADMATSSQPAASRTRHEASARSLRVGSHDVRGVGWGGGDLLRGPPQIVYFCVKYAFCRTLHISWPLRHVRAHTAQRRSTDRPMA